MNKKELIELLEELAQKDLIEGKDIFDHPCTVAVRAINKAFDDIAKNCPKKRGSKTGAEELLTFAKNVIKGD